ncbi:putative ribonuclease H-like domain-containing protein [Tanacetum coccineum]
MGKVSEVQEKKNKSFWMILQDINQERKLNGNLELSRKVILIMKLRSLVTQGGAMISEALEDESGLMLCKKNCGKFEIQKVWILKYVLPYGRRLSGPQAREVYQMDVKSAFLYGKIDEEVYVSQPPGFQDPKSPQKVYKVVSSVWTTSGSKSLGPMAIFPSESAFDLESYSDIDYARENLDRKSNNKLCCQFLWQETHYMFKYRPCPVKVSPLRYHLSNNLTIHQVLHPDLHPSSTPIVPDSIAEPTGENLGDHSFNDTSLSGIIKRESQRSKGTTRNRSSKKKAGAERVCIQTREDECKKEMVKANENVLVEGMDKRKMDEGVSTDFEKVSTDRPKLSTDDLKVSTDEQMESTNDQGDASEEIFEGAEDHRVKLQEEWEAEEERTHDWLKNNATNEALIQDFDDIKEELRLTEF